MLSEPRLCDSDGLFELPGPSILFGELRKRNRCRILLDPPSKFFNPEIVRHVCYGTWTDCVAELARPRPSVSRSMTLNCLLLLVIAHSYLALSAKSPKSTPIVLATPTWLPA